MRYTPRRDCQIPCLADLYEKYLPERDRRFVEVGASDGATVSNTVFLAEAGWFGLYIEPNPEAAKLCAENHKNRRGIIIEQTAISDYAGEADLFLIGDCSTLVWDKSAVDWGGDPNRKVTVTVTTLDRLLTRLHWKPGFELLVIDVENSELRVLGGFTIQHWQPAVVVIETHELDPAPERNAKAKPIQIWFERNGYRKVYTDHINSVFIR